MRRWLAVSLRWLRWRYFVICPVRGSDRRSEAQGPVAYLAAAVFAAALAFVLAGPFGLAALAGATVVGLAVSAFAARRLGGGVTGDVYGAAIELAEVSALLAFVALFSAGLDISPVWSG